MGYEAIWEWVYATYDVNGYLTAEELIYDVEQQFNADGRYFPPEAKALIKERFQYRREYREMQREQDKQKQIAEFIGSGNVIESLSDEIVDEMRNPKSEIMGIDMSEFATQRETVIPPDIVRYAQSATFFSRVSTGFKNTFNRILGRK